ncbi:hypothetical protein AXA65_14785 [Chryseobacterium sp. FP211-J200]|nr:hypothetical protein AXA65_14785 [Chryseobacterium sp. FP211-J200]
MSFPYFWLFSLVVLAGIFLILKSGKRTATKAITIIAVPIIIAILPAVSLLTQRNAPKTEGILFEEFFFSDEDQNKWLENANDELQVLKNVENFTQLENKATTDKLDAFYKHKAKYIFVIGGGCFVAETTEMEAKIISDSLFIIWHEPNFPCATAGKHSRTNMALEIDKKLYPNYKNFKVIIKNE